MKKVLRLFNANILKWILGVAIFVVTSASVFAADQQPSYLATINLNTLTSYTPSFCQELEINPDELKIGINPSFLFQLTKMACKPALYVGSRYKMDKWLFDTTMSEYQQQFFCGFDKKVDDLVPLILEKTDLRSVRGAISYVKTFGSSSEQRKNPEFVANERIVNDFLGKIDVIFNVRAVTPKTVGVFALNILVKTYLFKALFGKPDIFSMCWRISSAICSDPFNVGVIMKEAEVMMAEIKSDLSQNLPADIKGTFSPDFFPTEPEILNLKRELQDKIELAAFAPEPIVPADLALEYAINYDLSAYVDKFLDQSLQRPGFMKNYWYWFFKELFIFWSINVDLKAKFHEWITDDLSAFVGNIREINVAKESGEYSKIRAARESFKAQLKKIYEEKFSCKKFLKGMGASFAIDFVIWFGYIGLKNKATQK